MTVCDDIYGDSYAVSMGEIRNIVFFNEVCYYKYNRQIGIWRRRDSVERVKGLGRYQKVILLFVIVMVLVFAVLYSITVDRVGFAYKNSILVPSQENGNTIYSGKIQGKQAFFAVSANKTVTFQHGDKVYGPYTAKEDATAIPTEDSMAHRMTGVELCCGKKVIFRGGVCIINDFWWLTNEDGSSASIDIHVTTGKGITLDSNGNIIDPMEPSVTTILDLMSGPGMTHKGEWLVWFLGVFLCFITAIAIVFADELFRLGLAFRIRNAEYAEPSDWEIGGRYISWTLMVVCALVIFIVGLQ